MEGDTHQCGGGSQYSARLYPLTEQFVHALGIAEVVHEHLGQS